MPPEQSELDVDLVDEVNEGHIHESNIPFFSRVKADLVIMHSNRVNSICSELLSPCLKDSAASEKNAVSCRMKRIQEPISFKISLGIEFFADNTLILRAILLSNIYFIF